MGLGCRWNFPLSRMQWPPDLQVPPLSGGVRSLCVPGEWSLLPPPARPPALRSQPGAAGRCCESWLNFPFSSGMWGKGMLDALELLDPIGTYLD